MPVKDSMAVQHYVIVISRPRASNNLEGTLFISGWGLGLARWAVHPWPSRYNQGRRCASARPFEPLHKVIHSSTGASFYFDSHTSQCHYGV